MKCWRNRPGFWSAYGWAGWDYGLGQLVVSVEQVVDGDELVAAVDVLTQANGYPQRASFSTSWPLELEFGYQRVFDIARYVIQEAADERRRLQAHEDALSAEAGRLVASWVRI